MYVAYIFLIIFMLFLFLYEIRSTYVTTVTGTKIPPLNPTQRSLLDVSNSSLYVNIVTEYI